MYLEDTINTIHYNNQHETTYTSLETTVYVKKSKQPPLIAL